MGRPKGSKNKPKTNAELVGEVVAQVVEAKKDKYKWKLEEIKPTDAADQARFDASVVATHRPKRTRKALGSSPLEKLAKAGLTLEDLKVLLGQLPAETKPDAKAELRRQMMTAPISPAEIAKLRKEALANMAKVKDPQLVVQEAVDQVIKPNWANTIADGAGLRHFLVKANRNGDAVSFDKERWDLALKQAGIRGVLNTCKPEGSAEVDPQANQGGGSMNIWRVMIG